MKILLFFHTCATYKKRINAIWEMKIEDAVRELSSKILQINGSHTFKRYILIQIELI